MLMVLPHTKDTMERMHLFPKLLTWQIQLVCSLRPSTNRPALWTESALKFTSSSWHTQNAANAARALPTLFAGCTVRHKINSHKQFLYCSDGQQQSPNQQKLRAV